MVRYVMLVLDDVVYRRLELLAKRYGVDVVGLVESLVCYYVEKVGKASEGVGRGEVS
ncbi:MAG: hypothetical protein QXZ56_07975 [Sulfolobales archaeon]